MRLDRWLASLGIGSRSRVRELIRAGEVSVNGRAASDAGQDCLPGRDSLVVRGMPVDGRLTRHVMLHKPGGVLTAARDRRQPTVMELLPPAYAAMGCMPVGRLDQDTTGLLLLTTDGEMAHRLLSPKRHVWKTYEAEVEGRLIAADIQAFAAGVAAGDFCALPAEMEILRADAGASLARVRVREGQFHQIKRMFAACGHEVIRLHRQRFGSLELDTGLEPGEWRELTAEELTALRCDAGMPKKAGEDA